MIHSSLTYIRGESAPPGPPHSEDAAYSVCVGTGWTPDALHEITHLQLHTSAAGENRPPSPPLTPPPPLTPHPPPPLTPHPPDWVFAQGHVGIKLHKTFYRTESFLLSLQNAAAQDQRDEDREPSTGGAPVGQKI